MPGTSAQVVPRHPVNIYYNAETDAQELDEYQTLYPAGSFACPTTCNFRDVITQVVSGLFSTTMGNDPRPSYVHQTNIIGTPPAGSEESPDLLPPATYTPPATCAAGAPCTTGDGTLYQALDPFLYEYNEYFNSTAPIEQLTEQAIANLLAEQQSWSATTAVSGYIEGNVVTVNNSGSALEVPLTGTNVGSAYAGTQSGWTDAPTGVEHVHRSRGVACGADQCGHLDSAGRSGTGWYTGEGRKPEPAGRGGQAFALLRGGPGRPEEGVDEEGHGDGIAEVRGQERQGCQEPLLHRQVHAQGHGQDGHPLLPDQGDQDRPDLGQAAEEGIAESGGSGGAQAPCHLARRAGGLH